ncbi:hypothetical protein MED121_12345 [Marinomonas sp. MED121]|nr:hypothetical protein MED121_12345 [Marinomonas sp. MED121]
MFRSKQDQLYDEIKEQDHAGFFGNWTAPTGFIWLFVTPFGNRILRRRSL